VNKNKIKMTNIGFTRAVRLYVFPGDPLKGLLLMRFKIEKLKNKLNSPSAVLANRWRLM